MKSNVGKEKQGKIDRRRETRESSNEKTGTKKKTWMKKAGPAGTQGAENSHV
jgi:hypothetical protein